MDSDQTIDISKSIGAALLENPALLQAAFSIETVGILLFNLDGRIIDANPAFERMSGYTQAELRTTGHWERLTAPEFIDVTNRVAGRLACEGKSSPYEKQMIRKDGTRWWGLFAPTRISGSGTASICAEFILDITERKETEAALGESEARFRQTLEIETVGVLYFNLDGRITGGNHALARMSGYSFEQLNSGDLRWDMLTPPEWIPVTLRGLEELRSTGSSSPFEKEYLRPDGSRWWGLFAGKMLDANSGVEFVTDITERKRTEEALRESEERFRTLADTSPALIWQLDSRGDVIYVNRRCQEVTGLGVEQLLASGWHSILHPEDAPDYLALVYKAIQERTSFRKRMRAKTMDGQWHWFDSHGAPWLSANGEYRGHIGISIDITDAVQAEDALKVANLRKDEFLATLAHELRNPLAPISNVLHLLKHAHADGQRATDRLIGMMDRQVTHMVRLVDDLLEISRITNGKIELIKERVNLVDILRSAAETSMPLIQKGKHRLTLALPERPFWMNGDAVRLNQVFANLLNNAAKYTNEGGQITVTAYSHGEQAVVSVLDDGIGIPPNMLDRVFEMFLQVPGSTNKGQGGLGIGLSMVQRLVEMHGGTIEVQSEGPGKGSEFIVRLPLLQRVQAHSVRDANRNGRQKPPLSGCSVLIVDDNQDAADTLAVLLETEGAEVHVVHDGSTALAKLDSYHPQAVVLDIGLPDISGYEVAQRIRNRPDLHDVRLIALTGWGQEDDLLKSRASGFNEHLTKPVDFAALESLLIAK